MSRKSSLLAGSIIYKYNMLIMYHMVTKVRHVLRLIIHLPVWEIILFVFFSGFQESILCLVRCLVNFTDVNSFGFLITRLWIGIWRLHR